MSHHDSPRSNSRPTPPLHTDAFLFKHSGAAPRSSAPKWHQPVKPSLPNSFAAQVLVVISDAIECARIGRTLCQFGHSVSLACDPRDAASIFLNGRFDLVVLDLHAPTKAARLATERFLATLTSAAVVLSDSPELTFASIPAHQRPIRAVIGKPARDDSMREAIQRFFPT